MLPCLDPPADSAMLAARQVGTEVNPVLVYTTGGQSGDSNLQLVVRASARARAAAQARGIPSRALHFAPVHVAARIVGDLRLGDCFVVSSDYIQAFLVCRVVDRQVHDDHVFAEVHVEDIGNQEHIFHVERTRFLISISRESASPRDPRDQHEDSDGGSPRR